MPEPPALFALTKSQNRQHNAPTSLNGCIALPIHGQNSADRYWTIMEISHRPAAHPFHFSDILPGPLPPPLTIAKSVSGCAGLTPFVLQVTSACHD